MTNDEFGFGAEEECLMVVGIPCNECIWEEACKGNDGLINEDEELNES